MRDLPARLPPPAVETRAAPWRDAFFFLVAFGAVFGAAMLIFDLFVG